MDSALLWNRLWGETARIEAVVLPSRSVWSRVLRRGETVTCERGAVWVTQSGDATDYLLRAGESFTSQSRGRVVAQAFEYSLLCIEGRK